jgi:hypothetical protein
MERRIGVALSGGGYRAGAWGLGVLLYLADAGLHRRVVTASSVSGGSITNAVVGLQAYGEMPPQEMWQLSARLARRLAGNVNPFLVLLVLHAAAWATAIVGAALHTPALAGVALGVAVLLSLLAAPVCGDAIFASPIVWLFADLLAASVGLLALSIGEGWWWLGALLLLGVLLLLRGIVVGWALGRSLLRVAGGHASLSNLSSDIDHVLCACDLHGRHHVYFGRDFVYSFGLGIGTRPSLPLRAAVQASANLPGAFPPRAMLARGFRFTGARYHAPVLALTDGGVYDNMADEWLLGFPERARHFRGRAARIRDPELQGVLHAASERLARRDPNFVVIANASGPLGFKFAWTTFLPLIGELFALFRVKSILYDNGNTTRRRLIVDEFADGDLTGIIVHISTDPWRIVRDGRRSRNPAVRARAEAAASRLEATPGLDRVSTRTPANAATALYPLRRGRIGNLLQRSYALACVQAHIWHGLPLVEIPPLVWFEALEAGRVDARPALQDTTAATEEGLLPEAPGESVPVSVDAVRTVGGTEMARVTYFVVASEVPAPTWLIRPRLASEFSVEVLGLMGVICGPGPGIPRFSRPDQIAALFEEVEASPELSVELEDLWIPRDWLARDHQPARGDVYRIQLPLFQAAYRFRTEELSREGFVERTQWEGLISFSPEETDAFRAWADAQIDEARSIYPKDEQLRLDYQ